jgi:cyclohexyl-isocyanide hydratase
MAFNIGLLLFPEITQLDLTGPYEVFTKFPDAKVHLVAKTLDPVKANGGMRILPDITMADCPALDLICVPGGATPWVGRYEPHGPRYGCACDVLGRRYLF